ncbi:MAG: YeeE/YedE family protein [Candidatus Rokubacteria bacterium]|nr:YeeE/YedE family protein [Candidatus Rokubacteria bacterium]
MSRHAAATIQGVAKHAADAGRPQVQWRVVMTTIALLAGGAAWLAADYGMRHGALFLIGAGCGLVLSHAAFGFTAAFRAFVTTGDGRGLRAQMLMLAVATLLFAPILSSGRGPGTASGEALAPAGISVLVGAFLFGIGMQLGGGCGSGTIYHLGAGTTALAFTLVGFVAGSVIATFHMPFWWAAPSLGEVSLGEAAGWPEAVALQLVAFGLIAALSWWIERRLGRRHLTRPSIRGWARLVHGPWPLAAGGVALACLNTLTLVVAGHPWTITWAFSLWGAKLLGAAGYDLSAVPFWTGDFQRAALAAPVLADVTSVMDLGLVLGAALSAGLAGGFGAARHIWPRRAAAGVLGGLLLGYGSRIAFGCNIGAFFGGIASTSLHGWFWGLAALLGTPVGVKLRARFGVDSNP